VAKIVSELLLAGSVLCLVFAGILAFTIHALDVMILGVYFVILPRYLILLSAGLLVAAFVVWKTMVSS
jgi:hypothetical protein